MQVKNENDRFSEIIVQVNYPLNMPDLIIFMSKSMIHNPFKNS